MTEKEKKLVGTIKQSNIVTQSDFDYVKKVENRYEEKKWTDENMKDFGKFCRGITPWIRIDDAIIKLWEESK